jgi:hypothetical protein
VVEQLAYLSFIREVTISNIGQMVGYFESGFPHFISVNPTAGISETSVSYISATRR